jgi:acyl-CoA reductase-like NAD-dependent aldehyde dehydrogenase
MSESREVKSVPGGQRTPPAILIGRCMCGAASYKISAPPVAVTPVLLELGGQNPALVDATANIPDAAKKIVWGAMAWGGQW